MMKRIRNIYEDLKYYIAYQKITVPEALFHLAQKEKAPLAAAFKAVYAECCEEGRDFSGVWRIHMEKALGETPLTRKEKELFFAFPSCLGLMEEKAQASALDKLLREVEQAVTALETERKNKSRVIMSLGAASGVLLSILLL